MGRVPGTLASRRRRAFGPAAGPLLLAAGLGAVVLAAPNPGCEPPARDPRPVILFAADNQGVLAACGCPSNPTGGLAKRQGLVEQYRRRRRHVVLLDAGNVMPDPNSPVKVEFLAKALARSRYDAIALGEREFLLGVDRLRELRRRYRLPFLCANVRTEAGDPVAPAHVVRKAGDLKVGVFAVIADRAWGFPVREWRKGLAVEDPAAAARRQVRALAGCDLVVALAHMDLPEAEDLARAVDALDVVVAGRTYHPLRTPRQVGGTLLVAPGPAGRMLGALTVEPSADGRLRLHHDLTTLSARVPEAPWVMDLYWAYVKAAKAAPPPDWDEIPIPRRYEPAEACKPCHEPQYAHWRTTPHAHAYESVRKVGRQEDPECLLCHTMGLGRPGGFVSMERTPGLGRVTCQACHVVTSDHERRGVKPEPRMAISSRLCMSCHGPVQSPDFDYFRYKPKILHTPGPGARKEE